MEKAMTILGIVLPLVISGGWAWRNLKCQMAADKENIVKQFLLQKKYQDTKDSLPVLIEILDDLNKLHQAFVFKGIFCPPLEHRAPSLGMQDGLKEDEMSYARPCCIIALIDDKFNIASAHHFQSLLSHS